MNMKSIAAFTMLIAFFASLFAEPVLAADNEIYVGAALQVRFGGDEVSHFQLNAGPSFRWASGDDGRGQHFPAVVPAASLQWAGNFGTVSLLGRSLVQFGASDVPLRAGGKSGASPAVFGAQLTGGETAAIVVVSAFAFTGAIALLARHDLNSVPPQGQQPPGK